MPRVRALRLAARPSRPVPIDYAGDLNLQVVVLHPPAPASSVACPGGTFAGFTSGAREERPAVMHLFLPPPVGDEDFCVGDEFTVYDANGEMPLLFCISLLESV